MNQETQMDNQKVNLRQKKDIYNKSKLIKKIMNKIMKKIKVSQNRLKINLRIQLKN